MPGQQSRINGSRRWYKEFKDLKGTYVLKYQHLGFVYTIRLKSSKQTIFVEFYQDSTLIFVVPLTKRRLRVIKKMLNRIGDL